MERFVSKLPDDILHRCELVKTSIYNDENQAVEYIADRIIDKINNFPKEEGLFSLGLTTGNTPIGLYRELVKKYQQGKVSFKNVKAFSIDEFYPIESNNLQSRNYRIHADFLNHIDILPENIHLIDAAMSLDDVSRFCAKYDEEAGDIDLMLLGVGPQGQVGFNDIGSHQKSKTRLVPITHKAMIFQASRFADPNDIPKMAITLGIGTIMNAKEIILMAWGDEKADVIQNIVEKSVSDTIPASFFQNHPHIEVVVDKNAARELTIVKTPWVVGDCKWTRKLIREAVIWLCDIVDKPILELTYEDYLENNLGGLLDAVGDYDKINIDVFNDIQHTITGWPGGKPNADDSMRPVPATPFPKNILIFSPHPDDDVISMGGTFHRLILNGHNVHVAYETSGNVAVHDDVVLQNLDTAREIGLQDRFEEVKKIILGKVKGQPEPSELLRLKAGIRRAEARASVRVLGLNDRTNAHFLNLPFYETGGIKKGEVTDADIHIVVDLLRQIKPNQIYAAGDFSDPHGTHKTCTQIVFKALRLIKDEPWVSKCDIWLYRGAWQEWEFGVIDMAVPLSPGEMIKKRHAIYKHLSQKDIMPFPGADKREFWQRAEERTQNTANKLNKLGLAKYQAMELFVKYDPLLHLDD